MNLGMRITTGAMIRRYTTNLNTNLGDLDAKRNIVATSRNFNSIAENPSAAMRSFKLRSNFQRTAVQKENAEDALKKFDAVTGNVLQCSSMARTVIENELAGKNGTNQDWSIRQTYQQSLENLQQSFLQEMNGKYNENFIFGGASTKELPFTMDDNGEIFYRGLNVNTPTSISSDDMLQALKDSGLNDADAATARDAIMKGADSLGYAKVEDAIDAVDPAVLSDTQKATLKQQDDVADQLKYDQYFGEHSYRDIGFGMKEENGEIVDTSAFDTAVNGLKIFGCGVDEDGLPNNIVALAGELADILGKENITEADKERYDKIIDKFEGETLSGMIDNGLAALGTKQAFLERTSDQLTETSQTLNEQISDLDFCDPAEAITNLMWSQYAYNATLKVGNSLLSNSFIDFMS